MTDYNCDTAQIQKHLSKLEKEVDEWTTIEKKPISVKRGKARGRGRGRGNYERGRGYKYHEEHDHEYTHPEEGQRYSDIAHGTNSGHYDHDSYYHDKEAGYSKKYDQSHDHPDEEENADGWDSKYSNKYPNTQYDESYNSRNYYQRSHGRGRGRGKRDYYNQNNYYQNQRDNAPNEGSAEGGDYHGGYKGHYEQRDYNSSYRGGRGHRGRNLNSYHEFKESIEDHPVEQPKTEIPLENPTESKPQEKHKVKKHKENEETDEQAEQHFALKDMIKNPKKANESTVDKPLSRKKRQFFIGCNEEVPEILSEPEVEEELPAEIPVAQIDSHVVHTEADNTKSSSTKDEVKHEYSLKNEASEKFYDPYHNDYYDEEYDQYYGKGHAHKKHFKRIDADEVPLPTLHEGSEKAKRKEQSAKKESAQIASN